MNLLIYFVINSTVPSLPQSICTHFRESTNCSSSCSPCTSQTAHITPILGQLHWLPADTRILWICIPPFQRCYLHFHSRLSLWSPAAVLTFLITSLRCWYLPPAARLVVKSRRCGHVEPLFRILNLLPVRSMIDYKDALNIILKSYKRSKTQPQDSS